MRRRHLAAMALAVILLVAVSIALADGAIKLTINGLPLKVDIAPRIDNGRVMAPVRFVAEALGASVEWDAASRSVNICGPETPLLKQQVRLLEEALSPATPREAVEKWAEGVRTRNGALQYAVLSPKLREENLPFYESAGWVTGTSSPWVESFEIVSERPISEEAWEYEVVFDGATSTGPAGMSLARVSVRRTDSLPRLSRPSSNERWYVAQIAVESELDRQLKQLVKRLIEEKYGIHYELLETNVLLISKSLCDSRVSAEFLASVVTVPDCDTPADWPPQKGRILFLEENRGALSADQIRVAEREIEFWNREMQMYLDEPSEANEFLKVTAKLDGSGCIEEGTVELYYQDPIGEYLPVKTEDWLAFSSAEELVELGYELMRRLVMEEE